MGIRNVFSIAPLMSH